MSQRARRKSLLLAVLAASAFAWAATPAAAAVDYCVTCKNPDATYRCRITGLGSKPRDAMKLYCVIRTARDGNHASCSAKKVSDGCAGLVKVYDYDGPVLPEGLGSDPRLRDLKREVDKTHGEFDQPKGEAPQTLFQLGGRAVSASRKGLRNAGSAIGVTSSATDTQAAPAGDLPPPPPAVSLPAETAPDQTGATTSAAVPAESPGAAQRVKQAAQSTGSAVGGFARKSYRCMRSLFRNCSGDAENGALE